MVNAIAAIRKGLDDIINLLSGLVKFEEEYKKFLADKRDFQDVLNTKEAIQEDIKSLDEKKKGILSSTEKDIAELRRQHDEYVKNTNAILKKEEDRILALQIKNDETLKKAEDFNMKNGRLALEISGLVDDNKIVSEKIEEDKKKLDLSIAENKSILDKISAEKSQLENLRADISSRERKLAKEKEEFETFRDKEYKANTAALSEAKQERENTSAMLKEIKDNNDKAVKLIADMEEKKAALKSLESKIAKDKKNLDDKERAVNAK